MITITIVIIRSNDNDSNEIDNNNNNNINNNDNNNSNSNEISVCVCKCVYVKHISHAFTYKYNIDRMLSWQACIWFSDPHFMYVVTLPSFLVGIQHSRK
jgi:hypothetical protein